MVVRAKSIELPGRPTLSYIEQGDPAGVPIMLLHGVSEFLPFVCAVAAVPAAVPSCARDFSARSRRLGAPRFGYTPRDFAADLDAFMEVANLGPVIVVGHSMGSSVAECFALNYPGRVSGLVLVGAFAGGWQASPAAVELWSVRFDDDRSDRPDFRPRVSAEHPCPAGTSGISGRSRAGEPQGSGPGLASRVRELSRDRILRRGLACHKCPHPDRVGRARRDLPPQ